VGVLALLLPGLALASIGKVSVLEGTATRTDEAGQAQPLHVDSEIELKDVINVGPRSNLKLTLTDGSVIMLGAESRLHLDEATFEGQDRKGFSARLGFGKIWARVKKALGGSEAKFEITTERAVAGVRGTIFRVDYAHTAKAVAPQKPLMVVRVVEGRVVVEAQVRKAVKGQARPRPGKGEREQVPGPQEISQEEWEKKFVELQARQQVEVGEELGASRPLDTRAMKDAFGSFVDRNQ
jgi:hypothetical protein